MSKYRDSDPAETQEWLAALASLVEREGADRAEYILSQVMETAGEAGVSVLGQLKTPYRNSIPVDKQPAYPGDLALERKIEGINRWNAVIMVNRALKLGEGLGGHISSCNTLATVYEVGLNHFFKGRNKAHKEDLVYFQGHSSEINYARAYLEGRISQEQLDNFRRESQGGGLSSYPHPWLMPNFWQFATVSLGLGQLQGVYSARFLRYLEDRDLAKTKGRKVWVFCGDGEMDEPEARAGLCHAANEKLDNLVFIISCNLQRLDGLVRSNFKVMDEFEGLFKGCGWNVVKSVWGSEWDALFEKDTKGILQKALDELVDGDLQTLQANGGAYTREHFFGKSPELLELVADMTDEDIENLGRAGRDPLKVHAALDQASNAKNGKPTVVLLHGVKGDGLPPAEGQNIAHNHLEMSSEDLKHLRDSFDLSITDQQIEDLDYYHPGNDSPEVKYMHQRREAMGGYLPARFTDAPKLDVPKLDSFSALLSSTGDRELSTTMALARIVSQLLKDKNIGKYIVPMFSDEARTFGMESLFRQVGIYSHLGQLYTPEDKKQLMYYKESEAGQVLMEGITEAGCMASWVAAGTSYSTSGVPMIPIFTYYSMFGFQRQGDFIWAAADMRTRGFLFGATAGRTTLNGEGLQHQDGTSLVSASSVPSCIAYDPTYHYEMAVIVQDGLRRMYQEQEDVFYYVMAMNEKYEHPAMPKGAEEGILKGMYLLRKSELKKSAEKVQLLGSGTILREVLFAADMLEKDFNIKSDVWSVTSFNELQREAALIDRNNILHPSKKPATSYVEDCLGDADTHVIAATDYVRAYPEQIRPFIKNHYRVLGTDGYGRSDTRTRLRHFFEVDRYYIAYTTIASLVSDGRLDAKMATKAMKQYNIDPNKPHPVTQ
jgi:pyruvate dehydrogenase E1 component